MTKTPKYRNVGEWAEATGATWLVPFGEHEREDIEEFIRENWMPPYDFSGLYEEGRDGQAQNS